MNRKNLNFIIREIKHIKQWVVLFMVVSVSFSFSNTAWGQEENKITDFYEYANSDWLNNTTIPPKASVVNNWGILWDKVCDQSIEILSTETQYELDEKHQYLLKQLRIFYKSTAQYSANERKRVYLVQKHYPLMFGVVFAKITIPHDKEDQINKIIEYLTLAYREKISNSKKIKESAIDVFLSKLNEMQFVIGAPDISGIPPMPELSADSFEKNIQLAEAYQLKIKPEKPNWESPPFETDCRYNIYENAVKIYAGTLMATTFANEEDFPLIFATLGRTIAHEMTHAFDAEGRKFNKMDWKKTRNSLINQFNQYAVQDGYFVDGEKTLQENFADLGGVEVSLLALKLFMRDNYPHYTEKEEDIAMRAYFYAYAQFWKEKATSEFEISALERIHTPQKFRAIAPVYNQTEFYDIYEIDDKSEYYIPEELRVSIW